jgi:NADP-dependent 3-hydroxy acid dehydrogenase YdfG
VVSAPEPRTVVVTGGSSGIGAATAVALGRLGWRVAIGARRLDRLDEVAREIEKAGGEPLAQRLDVTEPDSIEEFFDAVETALGPADAAVSNAGTAVPGRLQELAVEQLQTELATNLLGPLLVARRALPGMLQRGRGDLVFVTSLNAVVPRPLQVGYTASKAGLEAMARNLQMDLEGTGIRATIVRPGPTRTELGRDWAPETIQTILDSWKDWGVLRHHRFLKPERVAEAVVTALTAPPGTHVDLIQVNPEAPSG